MYSLHVWYVFVQCEQMKLELSGSESLMTDGHTKKKQEYFDLDHDGCVAADDFGPVDMSKWKRFHELVA